jgi:hypothetical protein
MIGETNYRLSRYLSKHFLLPTLLSYRTCLKLKAQIGYNYLKIVPFDIMVNCNTFFFNFSFAFDTSKSVAIFSFENKNPLL